MSGWQAICENCNASCEGKYWNIQPTPDKPNATQRVENIKLWLDEQDEECDADALDELSKLLWQEKGLVTRLTPDREALINVASTTIFNMSLSGSPCSKVLGAAIVDAILPHIGAEPQGFDAWLNSYICHGKPIPNIKSAYGAGFTKGNCINHSKIQAAYNAGHTAAQAVNVKSRLTLWQIDKLRFLIGKKLNISSDIIHHTLNQANEALYDGMGKQHELQNTKTNERASHDR